MKNEKSINNLSELDISEMKKIDGGVIPLAVIAFAKGFAWGASAVGTAYIAISAVDKAVTELTE
jgi:lactobin A/cerein 7B family class IIb bacteriocin